MKSRPVTGIAAAGILTVLLLAAGCGSASSPSTSTATTASAGGNPTEGPGAIPAPVTPEATPSPAAKEPEHIKLQHILIAFAGKVPGKNVTRTEAEAAALAAQLLERARAGEDFDALVKAHTDDRHPGIYGLSNRGVTPKQGEFPRERMVPAFGDVGFALQPGETGMAPYDRTKSPYGWHIIRRLE